MRIAHVCYSGFPIPPVNYGGIERNLFALLTEQVKRGHDITLFAHGDSHVNGCKLVKCTLSGQEQATAVLAEHLQQRFDVIHDHSPYGLLGRRNTGVPVFRTNYGDPNIMLRRTFRDDTRTVFLSKGFAEFYGFPNAPVVYNPAVSEFDEKYFNPNGRAGWVVYIGSIAAFKGAHIAIEWAHYLGCSIGLFGPFKDSAEYIKKLSFTHSTDYPQAIRLLDLGHSSIVYGGMASENEKWELLSRARAVFVPSICVDNSPTVVLEGMLCGCPVVAHPVGGIPEIIGNVGGLATFDLAQIKSARTWIGSSYSPYRAHNRVLENYSVQGCANAYERLYKDELSLHPA